MKKRLYPLICCALFAFWTCAFFAGDLPVAAEAQTDACQPDSLFPESGNCGYQVEHYAIDFRWDEATNLLNGDVTLTLEALADAEGISLDFSDRYVILEVNVDGEIVPFSQSEVNLEVQTPVKAGAVYAVRVIYSGLAEEQLILQSGSQPIQKNPSPFCMVSEPTLAADWFPCNDTPQDKATFDLTVTVPAKYAAASNGRLESIQLGDGELIQPSGDFSFTPAGDAEGTATYRYRAADPMPPYLFTVCVEPFEITHKETADGVLQTDFLDPKLSDIEAFRGWADLMPAMIACFEPLVGSYPYADSGSIVVNKTFGGALETQTRSVYGSDMGYHGEDGFAHELAHQWVGDRVSIADWSDLWIKEGFATFAEGYWKQCNGDTAGYQQFVDDAYDVMVNLTLQQIDLTALSRQYLAQPTAAAKTFSDADEVTAGIELICGNALSEKQRASVSDALTAAPLSAEDFWDQTSNYCRRTILSPIKRRAMNAFFGMDASFGIQQIGPKSVTADFDVLYSQNPYAGGALVYLVLQREMGEEKFAEAMRQMTEQYAWGTISTAQFIALFSEVAGRDLSGLIQSWLLYEVPPDFSGGKTYLESLALYGE